MREYEPSPAIAGRVVEIVATIEPWAQTLRRIDAEKPRDDARIRRTVTRWVDRWARRHGKDVGRVRWEYGPTLIDPLNGTLRIRWDAWTPPPGIAPDRVLAAIEQSRSREIRFRRLEAV